jgi:HNH endonuclease.
MSEYTRQYYAEHKEQFKEYNRRYYEKNTGKVLAHNKKNARKYYLKDKANRIQQVRQWQGKVKQEVMVHYSHGKVKCNCCGEAEPKFLTIDHIDPTTKTNKSDSGNNLWGRLRREGFPEGYQVLCYNCNGAKGRYGVCPHTYNKDKTPRFTTIKTLRNGGV